MDTTSAIRTALAGPLLAMTGFKQFIVYKVVPSESRPGKTDKFPCDYRTGRVKVDCQDPQYWTDAETACATAEAFGEGSGVGFVFTEHDPFWFLDSDGSYRDGKWSDLTLSLFHAFTGCAIEVSNSNEGAHIFGTGTVPDHKITNKVYGLEFYHKGRFVALTGKSAIGNCCVDASAVLPTLVNAYFPPDTADRHEVTDGPREDWKGPADDSEIIRRAMNSRSAAAGFDGKASFADLWLLNEPVLSKNYPDPKEIDPYDQSAVDMAIAQHLAFWTGCDVERIERIMRSNDKLYREKWDTNKTYLSERTITKACARQDEVYGDDKLASVEAAKRRQEQIAENVSIGQGSVDHPTSSVLTEGEMIARYVNIIEGKRVLDLEYPRRIFALDEWKSAHKSSWTVLEDDSNKTKRVETTNLWEMNRYRKQVDTVTFRPGFNPVTLDPEGKTAANTWRPIKRTVTAGNPSLFLHHVDYLFGAASQRFLDWLAHIEQRPGELPHNGWVHISPLQGTGRNWLASVLCRVWSGYVAASFDLSASLRNGFNGALSQKLLVIVDEINEGGTDARWENAETLKSLMTCEHRRINPKYGHQRVEYNAGRWLIFSNHTSALPLTESDRRFNIARNDNPPMPPEYYAQLYAALNDPGFTAGVAELLGTRDISAFNPGAHAVMNEAKREMVSASRSDADDVLAHLVANHPADVIANSTLGAILTNQLYGKLTPHHRHAMDRAGVRSYGKAIRLGSGVGKVSILRNHAFWKEATTGQIQAELAKTSTLPPFGEWAAKAVVN